MHDCDLKSHVASGSRARASCPTGTHCSGRAQGAGHVEAKAGWFAAVGLSEASILPGKAALPSQRGSVNSALCTPASSGVCTAPQVTLSCHITAHFSVEMQNSNGKIYKIKIKTVLHVKSSNKINPWKTCSLQVELQRGYNI